MNPLAPGEARPDVASNPRDVDLGISAGSAAKTAVIHSIDRRCRTRIAVTARKLGVVRADIAVGLSLSLAHKAVGFDRRIDSVDVDTIGIDGVPGAGGAATASNPHRGPAAAHPLTVRSPVMVDRNVGVGAVVAARVDVHVDVVEMADFVEQVVAHGLGHVVALAHGEVFIDHDGDRGRQAVPDPAGLHGTDPLHPINVGCSVLDRCDDRRVDGVHESVEHLAGGSAHSNPSHTPTAPSDTASEVNPSVRAW